MKRKVLVLCALALLIFPPQAYACGVLTHGEIFTRAACYFGDADYPQYKQWITQNANAGSAGAGFPDWGWFTGFFDESEAAHSATFVNVAADYLVANYPKPWDEQTVKTTVFILGIFSHVVADTRYTTSRSDAAYEEGLIGVMHQVEFPGSFDLAHRIADFGGEAFTTYQYDIPFIQPWYLPTVDMAAIYNAQGFDQVTPQLLETAMEVMYLAALAERTIMAQLEDLFCRFTVIQKEHHQDYFAGGLDDMGIWTGWQWSGLIDRMEGADQRNRIESDAIVLPETLPVHELCKIARMMIDNGELIFSKEITDRGVIFSGRLTLPIQSANTKNAAEISDRTLTLIDDAPYGYLGTSLAVGDFNNDGVDDLAVGQPGLGEAGAPQTGAVKIIHSGVPIIGNETVNLSDAAPDGEILGTDVYGRFGFSMAVVDLNRDGKDDLAVSAPTVGSRTNSYFGKVMVFFGTGDALSDSPDLVIQSASHRNNLGWTLRAGDVDGDGFDDLLIGSPFASNAGYQHGQALIYLSSQNLSSATPLSPEDAAWAQNGQSDYDWFGYESGVLDFGEDGRFVVVGAPNVNPGRAISAGRIYGYDVEDLTSGPVFALSGASKFDKVGSSFAAIAPFGDGVKYLLVGAPSGTGNGQTQGGKVLMIETQILDGEIDIEYLTATTAFFGDQPFARLAKRIAVVDFNNDGVDDLWLSSPYRETAAGFEAGGAYLFFGGADFPTDEIVVSPDSADWAIEYEMDRSHFGNEMAFLDVNHDGYPDAVFGARQGSDTVVNNGRTVIFPAPVPAPSFLNPNQAQAGDVIRLELSGQRLDPEKLTVTFKQAQQTFSPDRIEWIDNQTVWLTLALPMGAPVGDYDLRIANRFGRGTLESALTITAGADDDDDDDDNDDDNDDNDDDGGSGQGDSGADDSDEGCGC